MPVTEAAPPKAPDAFILDLGRPLEEFNKRVRPIENQVNVSAGDLLSFLTHRLAIKSAQKEEFEQAISTIQMNAAEHTADNVAACMAHAAKGFGTELIRQINDGGFYSQDGFFDYYFAGFATDAAAVFRRRPLLECQRMQDDEDEDD